MLVFQLTPLYVAVLKGYPEIGKYLIEQGGDMESVNSDGVRLTEKALASRFKR